MSEKGKRETIKRLLPYIKKIIGERSIRQASADMGISASYLSEIVKGNYLPSAEVLRKMADEKSLPQGGVTLEDLMVQAGYQQEYVMSVASKVIENQEIEGESLIRDTFLDNYNFSSPGRVPRYNERVEQAKKFETTAKAICSLKIMEKMCAQVVDTAEIITGYKPNVVFNIFDQAIAEWWMDFLYCPKDYGMNLLHLRNLFGRVAILPPQKERKISFVTDNLKLYERFLHYAGKISIRAELSVILLDTKEMSVLKEAYLSHYEEGIDSEIYIV